MYFNYIRNIKNKTMKKYITLTLVASLVCLLVSAKSLTHNQKSEIQLTYLGKTLPLRDKQPKPPSKKIKEHHEIEINFKGFTPEETGFVSDKIAQRKNGKGDTLMLIQNFNGIHNIGYGSVPDTEGDIGINHYIQMINGYFSVYSKDGEILYGPSNTHTLFDDFPGPWDNMYLSDPITLYDHIADRWVLTNFAFEWGVDYYVMIAISATFDPLGEWHCFALQFENMPDYPKFGVWSDGYYMTANEWIIPTSGNVEFAGPTVVAFKREDFINGVENPQYQSFHLESPNGNHIDDISSLQPCDIDGPVPAAETPHYFVCTKDDEWGYPEDRIYIFKFMVDWNNPANTVFEEVQYLLPEPFSSNFSNMAYIPQPDVTTTLQSLCHFTMYRLQYRSFDSYDAMVFNHSVEVDGESHAGVRWYELRNYGNSWEIYQQGTFAPDGDCRWMGGVAMDGDGNIGLGYSVSGENTYPSVRVTGRNYFDDSGIMSFPETSVIEGSGSQQGNQRWGDYSMMGMDPADDLTFWYTQQYYTTTSYSSYKTRIVAFQLHKNLSFSTDSLWFESVQECINGKELILKNNSLYEVTIDEMDTEGQLGEMSWYIDPWNYNLPITLASGDSMICNIKIEVPGSQWTGNVFIDSLNLLTDYNGHHSLICLDDWIFSGKNNPILEEVTNFKVFPNPFDNNIEIYFELNKGSNVSLEILDQNYKIVNSVFLNDNLNSGQHIFNWNGKNNKGSKMSSGVYFCRITINNKSKIMKIIKE
jgi:hypothetical protein